MSILSVAAQWLVGLGVLAVSAIALTAVTWLFFSEEGQEFMEAVAFIAGALSVVVAATYGLWRLGSLILPR